MTEQTPRSGGYRRGTIAAAVALVLALAGATLIAVAALGQESPPSLPDDGTSSGESQPDYQSGDEDAGNAADSDEADGPILDRSEPESLSIPAIDVDSPLLQLGLQDDDSVEVPPEEPDSRAGWFDGSPTPGEVGPSVILGHVDSAEHGPAVFYDLTQLEEGDEITVDRADGTTAVFSVERTERYVKNEFPTLEVYGNIDHAGLRLITCGGEFDFDEGSYDDNIVTYATLKSTHPTE